MSNIEHPSQPPDDNSDARLLTFLASVADTFDSVLDDLEALAASAKAAGFDGYDFTYAAKSLAGFAANVYPDFKVTDRLLTPAKGAKLHA